MKFMKLGTRQDTFFTSDSGRTVSSEIATDVIVQVQDTRFLLHKFPLLSKCSHLKRLLLEPSPLAHSPPQPNELVELAGFPGGAPAFELCAKFCYDITITLCAGNIVAARCAAEYLQMSDEMEKGNLAGKLESFLKSCVLRRWKDSLVVLQSTRKLPQLSEELGITGRCIDAIASAIVANPTRPNSGGWWAEDISELGVDHFWRIMATVKSAEKFPVKITGEAVMVYARRWLPRVDPSGHHIKSQRMFLEKIVSLIPVEKGSIPCGFLLRLLKAANVLNASASTKTELARRAGIQLEEATVAELLIPTSSGTTSRVYDVDLVATMLEEFLLQGQQSPPESPKWKKPVGIERRRRSRSTEEVEFECGRRSSSVSSHGSKLKVAKIIDGYLQEIAGDVNLQLEKLVSLAEAVPEFARTDHDDLYHAINTYLKAHPDLNKSDRKRLCRVLNCKKLSVEACTHAAKNEMLPLRVVVQVLFFDQARSAVSGHQAKELHGGFKAVLAGKLGGKDTTDQWSISNMKFEKANIATLKMKLEENDDDLEDEGDDYDGVVSKIGGNVGLTRNSSARRLKSSLCSIPNKPKMTMMSKIWSLNRSVSHRR